MNKNLLGRLPRSNTRGCRSRSASILICVLVCLSVATALVASATQTALRARRQLLTYRQLQQTELLLQAGVERAVGQLRLAVEYQGETWDLADDTIPGFDSAQVKIEVKPTNSDDNIHIQVEARLHAGTEKTVKRSHTFSFDTHTLSKKE